MALGCAHGRPESRPRPPLLPAPKTYDEYYAGAEQWLKDHWGKEAPECPYCKDPARTWRIGDVAQIETAPAWPTFEGRHGSYALFPVICANCGHCVLVNALWIFEPQEPPS